MSVLAVAEQFTACGTDWAPVVHGAQSVLLALSALLSAYTWHLVRERNAIKRRRRRRPKPRGSE